MTDQTTPTPVERPAESPAADGARAMDDAITAAVSATLAKESAATEPAELPRDERGRFVSPTAQAEPQDPPPGDPSADAPTSEAPAASPAAPEARAEPTPAPPTDPDTPPLPEGVVLPTPVDRPLATEFTLRAPDGDELAVPDVVIEFTAAGKPRKEPLDKVVKLAQMGYHQAEREQRYEAIAQESAATRAEAEAAKRDAEQVRAFTLSLLTDTTGAAWLQAVEELQAENAPERVLARERAALEAERQRLETERAGAAGQQFFERELVPALEGMRRAMPTVLDEELGAKVLLTLQPFQVAGVIPPDRYARVREAIVADVLPWMRSLHETRRASQSQTHEATATAAAERDAKIKALEAAKAKAEAEAQKAKRSMGRAAQPVGRAGVASTAPPPRVIETVSDAVDVSVENALRATLQRQTTPTAA